MLQTLARNREDSVARNLGFGTMGRVERTRELARKRMRRAKLKKLRARYAAAKDNSEKDAIKARVFKLSPFVNLEAESP